MPTTPWLQWMLAIAMILTALYHIGHFVAAPPRVRRSKLDVDLTHAAMGTVMAIMLVGSLTSHTSRNLAIAFAFPAMWFAWRTGHTYVIQGVRAIGHPLGQVLICTAMIYMLMASSAQPTAAMSPGMHMGGMAMSHGGGVDLTLSRMLQVLLVAAILGAAACTATMWTRRSRSSAGCPPGSALAPTLTSVSQLAMEGATAYMLVLMF